MLRFSFISQWQVSEIREQQASFYSFLHSAQFNSAGSTMVKSELLLCIKGDFTGQLWAEFQLHNCSYWGENRHDDFAATGGNFQRRGDAKSRHPCTFIASSILTLQPYSANSALGIHPETCPTDDTLHSPACCKVDENSTSRRGHTPLLQNEIFLLVHWRNHRIPQLLMLAEALNHDLGKYKHFSLRGELVATRWNRHKTDVPHVPGERIMVEKLSFFFFFFFFFFWRKGGFCLKQ